jgi:hypothetical protein
MNTQILQTLLVTLIVSISAVLALRQVFPGAFRVLQSSLAQTLGQSHRSDRVRRLGVWLQPDEAKKGGCGSGLGCASCAGCGTAEVRQAVAIPLSFTPRASSRD